MIDIQDKELNQFLIDVYKTYGDDFIHYHHSSLKRRIEVHCIKLHIDKFSEYSKLILDNKKYFDEMFKHFSINVTQFFREPEQLKLFREKVIPYLKSYNHIKIWCAGCSSGESPYSLSMILDEEGILGKSQIYATDFNNRVLAHAKDGLFEIEDFTLSSKNYKISGGTKEFKDYFIKQGKYYKVKKYLKEHILFFNHNLVTDGVMNEFQLIICKNVVIYFDDNLKKHVINLFDESLECNGFLVLGKSEYLPNEFKDRFKLYIPKSKVYHKKCR
ncbi:MAG: protein-glutamate O-methyltransferase CheR [Campylobacterota bacterium]|nr:protein-glutamate O-methyltransferase CheR [Campylobacterota bacterium]